MKKKKNIFRPVSTVANRSHRHRFGSKFMASGVRQHVLFSLAVMASEVLLDEGFYALPSIPDNLQGGFEALGGDSDFPSAVGVSDLLGSFPTFNVALNFDDEVDDADPAVTTPESAPVNHRDHMYNKLAGAWNKMHGLRHGERAQTLNAGGPGTHKVQKNKSHFGRVVFKAWENVRRKSCNMPSAAIGETKRDLDVLGGMAALHQDSIEDKVSKDLEFIDTTSSL